MAERSSLPPFPLRAGLVGRIAGGSEESQPVTVRAVQAARTEAAPRPRRAAWFLNHRTLHDAEVPLLRSFGFEVYTPKIIGTGAEFRSCVPFWDDDRALTLAPADLRLLNATDFYRRPWSPGISALLAREFDLVVCSFYPELVSSALRAFPGIIMLRAFGREGANRYSDLLRLDDLALIAGSGGRIRFAPSYGEIAGIEGPVLRAAALHLPLALPPDPALDPAAWTGERAQLLFVCPEIATSPYYAAVHREIGRWFGDLPHVIAGQQPAPVADPAVLGFVPRQAYRQLYLASRAMIYTSREPRHLHYHPLEAVAAGLPLVYLRDGWLGTLGHDIPGACASLGEARRLAERLLAGDRALAEQLRVGQRRLLAPFAPEAVAAVWRERFAPLLATARPHEVAAPVPPPAAGGRRRVGIWLELRPDSPWRSEGLGRLTAAWLQGLIAAGARPVIAVPAWARERVLAVIEECGLRRDAIDVVASGGRTPPLVRLLCWLARRRHGAGRLRRILISVVGALARGTRRLAARIVSALLATSLPVLLLLLVAVALLAAPAAGWLLAHAGAIAALVLAALAIAAAAMLARVASRLHGRLAGTRFAALMTKGRRFLAKDRRFDYRGRFTSFAIEAYVGAMEPEFARLAAVANRVRDIEAWLVVNPAHAGACRLTAPVVAAVPDLVYLDHPLDFMTGSMAGWSARTDQRVRRLAARADAFVSFSRDVADRHIRQLAPAGRPVAVVRHAPMDQYSALYGGDAGERPAAAAMASRALWRAAARVRQPARAAWLRRLPLEDIPYLFVSSQNRPHKNLIGLLRAFEIVLRRRRRSLKLLTTGDLWTVPECGGFVEARGLHADVLSVPDLPAHEHAALYRLAALTVAPSFFEGGFPFVFSESVSVGTPVLLSRIACVEELLGPEDLALMTVDPADHEAMAEGIERALDRRDELLARQRALLDEQRRRGWDDVGQDLLAAIDRAREHRHGR